MEDNIKELLEEIKAYRNDMVARNYPHQQISNIITKWEMKKVKTTSEKLQEELEPIPNPITSPMSDEQLKAKCGRNVFEMWPLLPIGQGSGPTPYLSGNYSILE